MKIHTMEQRSPEWHEVRKGKMTASNAQAIASNGKGLETYIYSIMAEKYALEGETSFSSPDMDRGVELEEQARMTYEIETGLSVEQVGFVEMDEYCGCSPDGLIEDYCGIEIKCPNNVNYFRILVNGESAIDPKYVWQAQMNMLVTGRDEWHLVFYNTNFTKNLVICRTRKDIVMTEKLIIGIERGKEFARKIENQLKNNA